MICLDSVKNASFFTFLKIKSEFISFGKRVQTCFWKNPQGVTSAYKWNSTDVALWRIPTASLHHTLYHSAYTVHHSRSILACLVLRPCSLVSEINTPRTQPSRRILLRAVRTYRLCSKKLTLKRELCIHVKSKVLVMVNIAVSVVYFSFDTIVYNS
jgi:hypothetical protein